MKGGEREGDGKDVFAKVVGYLEEARKYSDVSAFGRVKRFNIDDGWQWKWDEMRESEGGSGQEGSEQSNEDDEDGGVGI